VAATLIVLAALFGVLLASPASAGSPPTPVDDSYSVNHNGTLDVAAPGVLGNDLLPSGPTWEALVVSPPAIGAYSLDANGHLTYSPDPNYVGLVQFTYSVFDGSTPGDPVYFGPATVTIDVTNELPVPADDAYTTNQDTELDVAAAGVLSNDVSPDGDPIEVFGIFTDPTHGTVTIHPDGSFEYIPAAGFVGTDTFEYEVIDTFLLAAELQSAGVIPKKPIATVTITVIEPTPTPTPTDTATPESTSTIVPDEPTEAATETPSNPTATTAAPAPTATSDNTGSVTDLPDTGAGSGGEGSQNGVALVAGLLALMLLASGLVYRARARLRQQ
jgi:hypothetical protein